MLLRKFKNLPNQIQAVIRKTLNGVFTVAACAAGRPYQRRLACSWRLLFHRRSSQEIQDEYSPRDHSVNAIIPAKVTKHVAGSSGYHTLDKRSSLKTSQTSLCLTMSQGWLPSHSSTLETGSAARSLAYSAGGSEASGRANGNLEGAEGRNLVSSTGIWEPLSGKAYRPR